MKKTSAGPAEAIPPKASSVSIPQLTRFDMVRCEGCRVNNVRGDNTVPIIKKVSYKIGDSVRVTETIVGYVHKRPENSESKFISRCHQQAKNRFLTAMCTIEIDGFFPKPPVQKYKPYITRVNKRNPEREARLKKEGRARSVFA